MGGRRVRGPIQAAAISATAATVSTALPDGFPKEVGADEDAHGADAGDDDAD